MRLQVFVGSWFPYTCRERERSSSRSSRGVSSPLACFEIEPLPSPCSSAAKSKPKLNPSRVESMSAS